MKITFKDFHNLFHQHIPALDSKANFLKFGEPKFHIPHSLLLISSLLSHLFCLSKGILALCLGFVFVIEKSVFLHLKVAIVFCNFLRLLIRPSTHHFYKGYKK